MISEILFNGVNKVTILPISKEICLGLIVEKYHNKNYFENGEFYCMDIDESKVEEINKEIYKLAKKNNENIIGSKRELEFLLNWDK